MAIDGHRLEKVWKWLTTRIFPGAGLVFEAAWDKFTAKFSESAIKIVADLEADLASGGTAKMALAIGKLGPEVVAAGWDASEVALRALIESALVAVRVEAGKHVVVPPPEA